MHFHQNSKNISKTVKFATKTAIKIFIKRKYNEDIELEFAFSKGNFEESYGKQKHNFVSYAKMFSVFDDIVENAVGIEVHNRNIENYKKDQTLNNVMY